MESKQVVGLEEGWEQIKTKGIDVLVAIIENGNAEDTAHQITPHQLMPIYEVCYDMCAQKAPYNWSAQLYARHGETIEIYLREKALPALQNQHGESLLNELQRRWQNHNFMIKWMSKFFMILNRYYVKHNSLPSLANAGLNAFKTVVFSVIKKDFADAILASVDKERGGEIVDTTLLRNCTEVFVAMGMGSLEAYESDLEGPFIKRAVSSYNSTEMQAWMDGGSTSPEYISEVDEILKIEASRVACYMHATTEAKLLRALRMELIVNHQTVLL
ncbi:unnamed protein product [Aphanomyces euteiches]